MGIVGKKEDLVTNHTVSQEDLFPTKNSVY